MLTYIHYYFPIVGTMVYRRSIGMGDQSAHRTYHLMRIGLLKPRSKYDIGSIDTMRKTHIANRRCSYRPYLELQISEKEIVLFGTCYPTSFVQLQVSYLGSSTNRSKQTGQNIEIIVGITAPTHMRHYRQSADLMTVTIEYTSKIIFNGRSFPYMSRHIHIGRQSNGLVRIIPQRPCRIFTKSSELLGRGNNHHIVIEILVKPFFIVIPFIEPRALLRRNRKNLHSQNTQ